MHAFQAEDFLFVQEAESGGAARGAMALLGRADPGTAAEDLERLTLGCRNARLLDVHQRLFGPRIEAFAECPECGEKLELGLPVAGFPPPRPEDASAELELEVDGWCIRYRLLDTRDVTAAARCTDETVARSMLIERCVLAASQDGVFCSAGELPRGVTGALAAAVDAADPLAETLLELSCPMCGAVTVVPFDVAAFVLAEVDLESRRLLREVHVLAGAYGWSEAQILALPARRRRLYLELILQ